MTPQGRARVAEAALGALTLAAVFAAREPGQGAGYRWMLAGACLAATAVVAWYAGNGAPSRRRVLLIAMALRIAAFPLEPALSDDPYRYVWDGLLQNDGHNPYRHRPNASELAELQAEPVYGRLNSASYFSVYPPASQLAFRMGGWAYAGDWRPAYYTIKGVIAIAEVAAVSLLLRVAPAGAVVLYAWHPLAVLEVAGQGHTEGLAVLGLVLAVWGVGRGRGAIAGVGLAVAGGAKLLPLALVPFAGLRAGTLVPLAAAGAFVAMCLPYAASYALANVSESLSLYVRSFEFAAGPYLALKALAAWWGLGDVSKTLGPLLAVAFVGGYAGLLWTGRRPTRSFAASASAVYALFFATATTMHPWYLVPALAMAPLLRRPGAWVWAAAVAPATYLFYTGPAWAYGGALALGWLGAAAFAAGALRGPALDRLMRRRARWKWLWIESAMGPIPPGSSVLDLGAAEGFVGEAAAAPGVSVSLADIVDANRTSLPHLTYDGESLPLDDRSVDVVLVLFVLHHARDPALVLAEAARLARRHVVVLESVPEGRRRHMTEAIDRLLNRVRQVGLRDTEPWLRMRAANEWRRYIGNAGLSVIWEGRRGGLLHPQALFVTEPARANGTPDGGGTT